MTGKIAKNVAKIDCVNNDFMGFLGSHLFSGDYSNLSEQFV